MPDLPARDTWVANGNSLTRWHPQFDLIEVHPARDGGRILRLRFDGIEREMPLTHEQARHLGRLLTD